MKKIILRFGKNRVLWLLNQQWFIWLWRCFLGIKILHLPAFSLCDFPPAQMIEIPESHALKRKQNYLFGSFKQAEPMGDDKNPVAVRIIDDAVVIAGMPFYISDDKIWIRENFDSDYAELFIHLLFRAQISQFYCKLNERQISLSARYLQVSRVIDKGISLLPAINNYWHFMFEQAPKILLSDMAGIPDNVPLLLPDNLHKNLYEIVHLLNQGKREIIYLPILQKSELLKPKNNKVIKINKLYHIADVINTPTYEKPDSFDISQDNPYHMQSNVIRLLVKQLLNRCNVTVKADDKVKLFILRNSYYRIAKDQEKLKEYLIKKGFVIFEPEKHSFAEQVAICARASVIVSYSGAAWTNIIFTSADTKKILFVNSAGKSYVSIWDLLCENFYALQNHYIPHYEGDSHGTPYLSEKNWRDLEEIINDSDG